MENRVLVKKYKWWRLLIIGTVTYILGLAVLILTENPNIFLSVVMLGNFLIPVTYVAFFYEKRSLSNVSMATTIMSFFYGGFLGTFAASILEPIFIHTFNFRTALMVGVIEESVKIIGVLFILRHKRHDLELDGLILGTAAGMGFAALESSGYAFTAFLQSGGSLSLTVCITLIRGILSPLGHGTWTGIVAAVLLRESAPRYFRLNLKVVGAYITVVILHGLWDGLPFIISIFTSSTSAIFIGQIVVGLIGVIIAFKLLKEGREQVKQRMIIDI